MALSCAFFLAICSALPGTAVFAQTTWYVDDANCPGPGSGTQGDPFCIIQAGIDAAQDGDTVLVADGTYTGVGNRDLDFGGRAITVRSQSGDADACVIDCQGTGRGFHFHSGEGADSVVESVTITNGSADSGGGMYCSDSSPTVSGCIFSSNSADWYGGGVYCSANSSPALGSCTFSNNSAEYGAGVSCLASSPTLTDCTFSDNVAQGRGGGMYCYEFSSPALTNCTFSINMATYYGGGMYCQLSCSPTLADCTFSDNAVDWFGGGMYCSEFSSPSLTDCVFTANSAASYAGGMYCGQSSSPPLTNCTFSGNSAYWSGGALLCDTSSSPAIAHCTFSNNSAGYGAGIYCVDSSHPTLDKSIIAFGVYGEAVFCEDTSTATLTCCDVYGNADGDWVDCLAGQHGVNGNICEDPRFCDQENPDEPYTLHSNSPCAAENNPACGLIGAWPVGCGPAPWYVDDNALNDPGPGDPGVSDPLEDGSAYHPFDAIQEGIDAAGTGATVLVLDGTYTGVGNRDLDFGGKDITVRSQSGEPAACVIDCQGAGRGFHFHSGEGADSRLEGVTIENGYADAGGGVYCSGASPALVYCVFADNEAAWGGGALYCIDQAAPEVASCDFRDNNATVYGGAISCTNSSPTLDNCTFASNTAEYSGGGMYCYLSSSPALTYCTFFDNWADYGGGIRCTLSSSPALANCTLSDNAGQSGGGGVYCWDDCHPTLANTIIAFSVQGEAVFCDDTSGATLTCCDVYGNADGDWVGCIEDQDGANGNISLDPQFCEESKRAGGSGESGPGRVPAGSQPGMDHARSSVSTRGDTAFQPIPLPDGAPYAGPLGGDDGNEASRACPGTLVYRNDQIGVYFPPGAAGIVELADDLTLHGTDCKLLCYQLDTYAGAGGPYDVTVGLYTDCPGNGGTLISGTEHTHMGVPVGSTQTLEYALTVPATIPHTVWMVVSFSTNESGWMLGGMAELGFTSDIFGANVPGFGWDCGVYFTTYWSGFAVKLYCEGPPPQYALNSGSPCAPDNNPDCGLIGAWPVGCGPTTWYVDNDAPLDPGPDDPSVGDPDEDGSADHPFDAIQEGIDAAQDGDTVLVVDGTYAGLGNRDIDFLGKAINVRSQSGNADACVIDCQEAGRGFYFHTGEGADAVLEGVTITGGYAESVGAGMYCVNSSPKLIDVILSDNFAAWSGGGMACAANASPALVDCDFTDNAAAWGGGGIDCSDSSPTLTDSQFLGNSASHGGAVHCSNSAPTLTGCTFTGNSVDIEGIGGAIKFYAPDASPKLSNCTFSGNSASGSFGYGGAIYIYSGQPVHIVNCTFAQNAARYGGVVYNLRNSSTLTNCRLTRNSAEFDGGAIYNDQDGSPTVANCTLGHNSAANEGGAIFGWESSATLANCILWGNTAPQGLQIALRQTSTLSILYSDVQGGQSGAYVETGSTLNWGPGNIVDDPQFADPDGPDDDPNTWQDNDYRLSAGSLCIDTGDNASVPADICDVDEDGDVAELVPYDLDGEPRVQDGEE